MTTFAQNTQHITGPSSQRVRVRSVEEVAEGLVLTRPPAPVSLSMSTFSILILNWRLPLWISSQYQNPPAIHPVSITSYRREHPIPEVRSLLSLSLSSLLHKHTHTQTHARTHIQTGYIQRRLVTFTGGACANLHCNWRWPDTCTDGVTLDAREHDFQGPNLCMSKICLGVC